MPLEIPKRELTYTLIKNIIGQRIGLKKATCLVA